MKKFFRKRWVSLARLRVYASWPPGYMPATSAAGLILRAGAPCQCRCFWDIFDEKPHKVRRDWCHICAPKSGVPCSAEKACPHWGPFWEWATT